MAQIAEIGMAQNSVATSFKARSAQIERDGSRTGVCALRALIYKLGETDMSQALLTMWKINSAVFKRQHVDVEIQKILKSSLAMRLAKSRVKKPVRKRKRTPLYLEVSEAQKEIICVKAQVAGTTLMNFILSAVVGSDYKPKISTDMRLTLLMLNRELTGHGHALRELTTLVGRHAPNNEKAVEALDKISLQLVRTLCSVKDMMVSSTSSE